MNFRFIAVVIVMLSIVGGVLLFIKGNGAKPKEVHFHAGFQVYSDNALVDFSDLKYMNIEPCTDHAAKDEDEQLEKAHLHDGVGDVVHVHRNGATWADLFKNISYPLKKDVVGYINGQKVVTILNRPIMAYDSAVFFLGENLDTKSKIGNHVTKKHIQETEQKSENCGS